MQTKEEIRDRWMRQTPQRKNDEGIASAMEEYAAQQTEAKDKRIAELEDAIAKAHWHGWYVRERLDGPDKHDYTLPNNWPEFDYEEKEQWFLKQFKIKMNY